MRVFEVRNVHAALPEVLAAVFRDGVERNSRNGKVLQFPEPVTVVYQEPTERVLFWEQRDANPFFHLMEAIWMLVGRNDVKFPATFAKQIAEYSDDGNIFWGAYGHRWRYQFGIDQLDYVIFNLNKNPEDRRQVIQMWDCSLDLGRQGKDFPCNVTATVQINTEGRLDLTVFNRSNDIIWGMLGANAVHFSMLQEYIAGAIRVPVGKYYQVSVNAHVYVNDLLERCKSIALAEPDPLRVEPLWNPYDFLRPFSLFQPSFEGVAVDVFDKDLSEFFHKWECNHSILGVFKTPFFNVVVEPMFRAFQTYKSYGTSVHRFQHTLSILTEVRAADWRRAAEEWVERRRKKVEAKVC